MKCRLSNEERRKLRARGWVKNVAETAAAQAFQHLGISYVRRGYPDFTIIKDDRIVGFIEVKPHGQKALRRDQIRFAAFCEQYGIPFMKWTPDDGEEAIAEFTRNIN